MQNEYSWIFFQTNFLVIDNNVDKESNYKCKQARKYAIPIVGMDFLHNNNGTFNLVWKEEYLLEKRMEEQSFSEGRISGNNNNDIKLWGSKCYCITFLSYNILYLRQF